MTVAAPRLPGDKSMPVTLKADPLFQDLHKNGYGSACFMLG
jgi:hypothetical protein